MHRLVGSGMLTLLLAMSSFGQVTLSLDPGVINDGEQSTVTLTLTDQSGEGFTLSAVDLQFVVSNDLTFEAFDWRVTEFDSDLFFAQENLPNPQAVSFGEAVTVEANDSLILATVDVTAEGVDGATSILSNVRLNDVQLALLELVDGIPSIEVLSTGEDSNDDNANGGDTGGDGNTGGGGDSTGDPGDGMSGDDDVVIDMDTGGDDMADGDDGSMDGMGDGSSTDGDSMGDGDDAMDDVVIGDTNDDSDDMVGDTPVDDSGDDGTDVGDSNDDSDDMVGDDGETSPPSTPMPLCGMGTVVWVGFSICGLAMFRGERRRFSPL